MTELKLSSEEWAVVKFALSKASRDCHARPNCGLCRQLHALSVKIHEAHPLTKVTW